MSRSGACRDNLDSWLDDAEIDASEIARQSRLGVSEAVPEAKTGVQSDSGAGIGLPEPSVAPETVTQLQQAVIEHDADMARLDRNTLPPLETIRISLPGLSGAEIDRLRQIQKEVAERPSDENAMESACGEYNCPCHYQIGFLLEVIAKTTSISLPALRAVVLTLIDDGWQCSKGCDLRHPWAFPTEMFNGDRHPSDEDIGQREKFCDLLAERLRQLPARGLRRGNDEQG